jgi:hypothetical protein
MRVCVRYMRDSAYSRSSRSITLRAFCRAPCVTTHGSHFGGLAVRFGSSGGSSQVKGSGEEDFGGSDASQQDVNPP